MLTTRDRSRLAEIHPALAGLVMTVAARVPLMVVEGARSLDRQRELFRLGKSRTLNSRHLPKEAKGIGYPVSHAVDLAPLVDIDGDLDLSWRPADFEPIATAMKAAASAAGVPIAWGGDWRTFVDMPHFELSRTVYP
jgi:peptidoglycan L-alanyl-D-glutamate endopeptidase CwlK